MRYTASEMREAILKLKALQGNKTTFIRLDGSAVISGDPEPIPDHHKSMVAVDMCRAIAAEEGAKE